MSTDTPRRASWDAANRASPPLLPDPATTARRIPLSRPNCSRISRAQTTAKPVAARCIRAPSGIWAMRASSAARIVGTSCTGFMHPSWPTCVPCGHPPVCRCARAEGPARCRKGPARALGRLSCCWLEVVLLVSETTRGFANQQHNL